MAFTIPVLIMFVGETFGATGAGLAVSVAVMAGQIASSLSGGCFSDTSFRHETPSRRCGGWP
jgi:hypothetical protein